MEILSFSDEYLREIQTTLTKVIPHLMIVTIKKHGNYAP